MWRQQLWKIHAVLFVALAGGFFMLADNPGPLRAFVSIALGAATVAFMTLYPQLRFKSQMRTILMDEDGLKTTIGKKSAARSWSDLKSIDDEEGYLIVTVKNGNAFIIPPRAFTTPEARADFCLFARSRLMT
jgi:hypothetical protein